MKWRGMLALALLAGVLGAEEWRSETFAVWPLRPESRIQSSVISFSDWLVFGDANYGEPGIRAIVNQMAASGIRNVWFRLFGGGHAQYPTRVPEATVANYAGQGGDFSQFDGLAATEKFARKLGLGFCVWFTPLEEAHGWPDNVRSRYVDFHPELGDRLASGLAAGAPSLSFEAYRTYKCAFVEEVFSRYRPDALVIDLERGGAPRRSNQWGYLPDEVAKFNGEFKHSGNPAPDDPDWLKFRARHTTELIEAMRLIVKKHNPQAKLIVMYPGDRPLTAHWDIADIAKRKLADELVLAEHGATWGSPVPAAQSAWRKTADETKLPVRPIIYTLSNGRAAGAEAVKLLRDGVPGIVWFETTYLNFHSLYDLPLAINAPMAARIESPVYDFSGGGEVTVLGAGDWTLAAAGKTLGEGKAFAVRNVAVPADFKGKLELDVKLPARSQYCGIALQGFAIDAAGRRQPIQSDGSWPGVTTVAQPGIPPFLTSEVTK